MQQSNSNEHPTNLYSDKFHEACMIFLELTHNIISDYKDQGKTSIDPKLISGASELLELYPGNRLTGDFIDLSYQHWTQIHDRDETFFLENSSTIFDNISPYHIDIFKPLFDKNVIDDNDKTHIWKHMVGMIKISILYIHTCRGPTFDTEGNKKYAYKYMPRVKIGKWARLVELTLEWT